MDGIWTRSAWSKFDYLSVAKTWLTTEKYRLPITYALNYLYGSRIVYVISRLCHIGLWFRKVLPECMRSVLPFLEISATEPFQLYWSAFEKFVPLHSKWYFSSYKSSSQVSVLSSHHLTLREREVLQFCARVTGRAVCFSFFPMAVQRDDTELFIKAQQSFQISFLVFLFPRPI